MCNGYALVKPHESVIYSCMQAPYTDEGWVDDKNDTFGWAKSMFGGGKKKEPVEAEEEEAPPARQRGRVVKGKAAQGRKTQKEDEPEKKRWPWG